MTVIEFINQYILGAAVPSLLILCGVVFCFKLGFFHFRHPIRLLSRAAHRSESAGRGGTSRAGALCMALAGTLGTGNIVGVALAICGGGAGAVFWMWVSAGAAMIVKYAEITLALDSRTLSPSGERRGGAMYYIRGGTTASRVAATVFALLCIGETLVVGSGIQASAGAEVTEELLGVPSFVTGGALALLTAAVIFGGTKKITRATTLAVPLMTLGYILISIVAIAANRHALPDAFRAIFEDAFTPRAVGGGVLGFLLSPALRFGVSRGLLSNEAGCGTAPTAHAASNEEDPAVQGLLGIVEVFVDTMLLCTMTALVILTSGVETAGSGALVTVRAYAVTFGDAAAPIVAAMILVFAWATMLCQAFYGEVCVDYLGLGGRSRKLFLAAFCLSALLSSLAAHDAVWELADLLIGSMTLINVAALLVRAERVCELSAPLIRSLSRKQ